METEKKMEMIPSYNEGAIDLRDFAIIKTNDEEGYENHGEMVIRFKTSVIPYGIDGYIKTTGKKDETVLQKIKEIEEKISELEKRISTIFAMKRELGKANFSKDGKYISGG